MSKSNSEFAAALLQELEEYDGRSIAALGEIEHRWSQETNYPNALLDNFNAASPIVQNGASWLFKAFVEKGGSIAAGTSEHLSRQVICLTDWSAMLHVCQSIRYLKFAEDDAGELGRWTRQLLTHNRPFLRAWALDALVHLASFDPALRPAAEMALAEALEDSAASVRTRARKLELWDGS